MGDWSGQEMVVWEESWIERKAKYSKYIVCKYKILKKLILDFEKIKEMCLFREQRSYRYRPGSHCKQLHLSQRADDICQGDNRQTCGQSAKKAGKDAKAAHSSKNQLSRDRAHSTAANSSQPSAQREARQPQSQIDSAK